MGRQTFVDPYSIFDHVQYELKNQYKMIVQNKYHSTPPIFTV